MDMELLISAVTKQLKHLPRLSAPGPVAMRNEHLQVLSESTEHGRNIAELIAKLVVNDIPLEIISFLRGGKVLPLPKDDGYRPLTLANVLRRTALRVLIRHRKDAVAEAVGSLQYAAGKNRDVTLFSSQCRRV